MSEVAHDRAPDVTDAPAPAVQPETTGELRPDIRAQLDAVAPGDHVGLAGLVSRYAAHSWQIFAAAASRLGNATVQRALAIVHPNGDQRSAGLTAYRAREDQLPKLPPSFIDESDAQIDAQVAVLPTDQHSYYDQILAGEPDQSAKTKQKALKMAVSSRTLTPDDQQAVLAAQQKLATIHPKRIDTTNPNVVQIEISFDGTWNNKDDDAFAKYDTNPAEIYKSFAGPKNYEVGVGTRSDTHIGGGATGAGISDRINEAYDRLVAQINDIKKARPSAEIVLVVTGFSRGAATARAFTNALNARGVPVLSSRQNDGSYAKQYEAPRIGVMVLFDTVEMDLADKVGTKPLDLAIPNNAENVLHITARDEERPTFPLTRATHADRSTDNITEVSLPGAHSDIGGGYPNAYSNVSLGMARNYMAQAGVTMDPASPAPTIDPADPSLRLHDSGKAIGNEPRRKEYPRDRS